MSWRIKVPATTANLGAGFDSIGIALDMYLFIKVSSSDKWSFVSHSAHLKDVPKGKDNYIYQIALKIAKQYGYEELPACHVELFSDIPLARGLGSSATAIACGIELANLLLDLHLSNHTKVTLATEIEGHPDNVAPAILGGCVIGYYDGEVDYVKVPLNNLVFVTIVPDFELKTKDARKVLPEQFSHRDAVQASSIANVTTAALFQGNWPLLGKMMEKEMFHQPFRKALIPHYDKVKEILKDDVYGVYLSGAGPTMIALAEEAVVTKNMQKWRNQLSECEWLTLHPTNQGLEVVDGY
ncbi:homoserine kinase [Streptohalobacillus salinus]|uniref:Homoserine kinase n=1 Tax=Streptohalobacillus salinus TaxID=621096 RepID=A0A2V3WAG5_9BACI|nr:homoserine kinase [Streptohalobacillus salinus]PXW91397.1 homoserine kinase [Streptohalobacillus salinus]